MLLPHMAKVINKKRVSTNMAFHGLFCMISLKSCLTDVFWFTGGSIRSFVVKNVITNRTTTRAAKREMVNSHPFLRVALSKFRHQRQGQSLYNKSGYSRSYKTIG